MILEYLERKLMMSLVETTEESAQTDWLALFFAILIPVGLIGAGVIFFHKWWKSKDRRPKRSWEDMDRPATINSMMEMTENLLIRQIQSGIVWLPVAAAAAIVCLAYLRFMARAPIEGPIFWAGFIIGAGGSIYILYYVYRLKELKGVGDWLIAHIWFWKNQCMTRHIHIRKDIEISSNEFKGRMDYLSGKVPLMCQRLKPYHKIVAKRDSFVAKHGLGNSDPYDMKLIRDQIEEKIAWHRQRITTIDDETKRKIAPRWVRMIAKVKGPDYVESVIQKVKEVSVDTVEDMEHGLVLIHRAEQVEQKAMQWMTQCVRCEDKCSMYYIIQKLSIEKDFKVYEFDIDQFGAFEKMIAIFPGEWRAAIGKQNLQVFVRKLALSVNGSLGNFLLLDITETVKMMYNKKLGMWVPKKIKTPIVYLSESTLSRELLFNGLDIGRLDKFTFQRIQKERIVPEAMSAVQITRQAITAMLDAQEAQLRAEYMEGNKKFMQMLRIYGETGETPSQPITKTNKLIVVFLALTGILALTLYAVLPRLGIGG